MGLDMYLSKKTYVKYWEHNGSNNYRITVTKNGQQTNIDPKRITYITEELMYWRKANQIHGWFTSHCDELVGDVQYRVTLDNLKALLEDCYHVLHKLQKAPKKTIQVHTGWANGESTYSDVEVYECKEAMDVLPPTQGFFFGSDEINEWYIESLVETVSFIEKELASNPDDYEEYEYYASW